MAQLFLNMRTIKFPPFLYLTRSAVRRDLLALFFLNPGESYYVRELERRLKHSVGTLARELKTFSGEGLLSREARGKEVFYRLNPQYPLFQEMKSIVEKTCGIPEYIRRKLAGIKEIQEAYLYGSFATSKVGAESDIDLLLIGKETEPLREGLKELELRFGREINRVIYPRSEFDKKRKDKSEFLCQVMKDSLISLKP